MLAARAGVDSKIEDVKSSTGNTISISPAGFRGFEGGGNALTTEQLENVSTVDNVVSVTSSLSDRLTTDDTTNLESDIEPGDLGGRFGGQSDSEDAEDRPTPPAGDTTSNQDTARPNPIPHICSFFQQLIHMCSIVQLIAN